MPRFEFASMGHCVGVAVRLVSQPASSLGSPFRGTGFALIGIALISAVINVLGLTGALFMLQISDRVLRNGGVWTLVALSLLVAALFAIYGLLDRVRGRVLIPLALGSMRPSVRASTGGSIRLPLNGIQSLSTIAPLIDFDSICTSLGNGSVRAAGRK